MADRTGTAAVHIIINDDFPFVVMQTMQPANILLQRATPRNRHGEKKRVQTRIVKTFADVTASRQQDSFFAIGNRSQLFGDTAALFCTHAAFQHDDMFDQPSQSRGKFVHLAGAFGQKNG